MNNNNLKEKLNSVKVLEKLISFNTVKDKENLEIISYIEEYLSKYDFRVIKKDKYLIMESNFGNETTKSNFGGWNRDWFFGTVDE